MKIIRIYLNVIKAWFSEHFKRELNEIHWSGLQFNLALNDELTFSWEILVRLDEEFPDGLKLKRIRELINVLYIQLFAILNVNSIKNPSVLSSLEKQFSIEYKGNVHKRLMQRIEVCYKQWVEFPRLWHSPYMSIVQSSGYGKSRACKEIAMNASGNWLTVFICCRRQEWKGYPPRSEEAVFFFDSVRSKTAKVATAAIALWIKRLLYFRFVFRIYFLNSGDVPDVHDIVENVRTEVLPDLKSKPDEAMNADRVLDAERKERDAFWSLCFNKDYEEYRNIMFNFVATKNDLNLPDDMFQGMRFFLVIDEARYLSETKLDNNEYTLSHIFRSALKEFSKELFAVLVDTQSRIANFSPAVSVDPSLRITGNRVEDSNINLFHPFTAVATTDLLCDQTDDSPERRLTLG
jgi:hypothetical protein